MRTRDLTAAAVACLLGACAAVDGGSDLEGEARRQVDLARSLEASGDIRAAAHEYSIVAERYRSSSVYPMAVRKAALLYASPANPRRNDSLAAHWLSVYAGIPLSPQERETALIAQAMALRVAALEQEAEAAGLQRDSLRATLRRYGNQIGFFVRRVQDLEAELQSTIDELRKLKEVDIRTSRSKRNR